LKATGSNLKKN